MTRGGKRPGAGRPRTRTCPHVTRAVEIREDQDAWLRAEAEREGRSVSALVRDAIDLAHPAA